MVIDITTIIILNIEKKLVRFVTRNKKRKSTTTNIIHQLIKEISNTYLFSVSFFIPCKAYHKNQTHLSQKYIALNQKRRTKKIKHW